MRPDREGYVSLLALSFGLGLALFAGGLSVGLQTYLRASARQERVFQQRVALESASAAVLGRLAAGQAVAAASTTEHGGRQIFVNVSTTSARIDLRTDPVAMVEENARAIGLTLDGAGARSANGLAVLSAALGLDGDAEDCLRLRFTYGRGLQARSVGDAPSAYTAVVGEQFDVRASTSDGAVLWTRARMSGAATGWSLHDYRFLPRTTGCRSS